MSMRAPRECPVHAPFSDGKISATEVARVLRLTGDDCDLGQAEAMIKEFDEDGDACIDLGEFTRAMAQRNDVFSKIVASVRSCTRRESSVCLSVCPSLHQSRAIDPPIASLVTYN